MGWLVYLAARVPEVPSASADPAWITASVALAAAVIGVLAWVARWAWRISRRVTHFLDSYFGEPARDGVAARPGVMARLGSLEETIGSVLAETRPDHGRSLRDVMARAEADIAGIKNDVAGIKNEQEVMRERIEVLGRGGGGPDA